MANIPHGLPPARPRQANSSLRDVSPAPAPPAGRLSSVKSPRNSAAFAVANQLIASNTGFQASSQAPAVQTPSHTKPEAAVPSERDTLQSQRPVLSEKRQTIFKHRFREEALNDSRREQLLDLVKVNTTAPSVMLSAANIRQAEEIDMLRSRQTVLEKRLDSFSPLEGLLHYMSGSEDPRMIAMLAPPTKKVSVRTNKRANANTGDPQMHDMELPPAESLQDSEEVAARMISLMRLCGDGAGVTDEGLLHQVRMVEGVLSGVRLHDDGMWGESRSESAPGTPAMGMPTNWNDIEGDNHRADIDETHRWFERQGSFPDGVDPFTAEIAAVGTHLKMICGVCGMVFTENKNVHAACRFHPGTKQLDANWNSLWSCCNGLMTSRGCHLGPHVQSLDEVQPSPSTATDVT